MFGNLEDGPDLTITEPETDPSHDFHDHHHYCLSCHCSRFSMLARHVCVPKVASQPVTVQPRGAREVDWFSIAREFSA